MKAIVFPGQGSQYLGMGSDLFNEYADLFQISEEILGYSLQEVAINEAKLNNTLYAQPLIYCVNACYYLQLLKSQQIPQYVLGHSLGEYNALLAAGVYDFVTGLKLIKQRAELMAKAENGMMIAIIGLSLDEVKDFLIKNNFIDLSIANYNAPDQFVVSGPIAVGHTAVAKLEAMSVRHVILKVSGAFHSKIMQDAGHALAKYINSIKFKPFKLQVIANVNGKPYQDQTIAATLAEHITSPVNFTESIKYLLNKGVEEFVEVGDLKILTNLIGKITNAHVCSKI